MDGANAATQPCNQYTAPTPAHQIRSEIFDCAIKEGAHYDLARTICMLHSAEWEWCPPLLPNQLRSSTRRVIGTWSDRHSSEVQLWSPTNGIVEDSKINNFSSLSFMPQKKQNKHVEKHGHTSMCESVHVSVCAIKLFVWGFFVFASLIFLLVEL